MVKRVAQLSLVVLLVLILLIGIGWKVLQSDHAYVIRKIQETALDKFNAEVQLAGYQLKWVKPYPLIELQIRGLSVATAFQPQHPFLRLNHAKSEFNPWDLLSGDFNAQPLLLDSVWIHLYEDSLHQSNLTFGKDETPEQADDLRINFSELPSVEVNYLDFHREDDYHHKWQWAKFSDTQIQPFKNQSGDWSVHLLGDCFFEGLVFKQSAGGFLMNTDSRLDVNLSLAERGQAIRLDSSFLTVDQHRYAISGQFLRSAPKRIQLQISNEGVMLEEVLPLLSDKVQAALSHIQIDQPIRATFNLNDEITQKEKGVIQVDFSIDSAQVQFKDIYMTAATVAGTYSNDCDGDGAGSQAGSCIQMHQLDGAIIGLLPSKLQGTITDLDDPQVNVLGAMDIQLPELNPLLIAKDKFTFATGRATVDFRYDGPLSKVLEAPFDEQSIKLAGEANFEEIALETTKTSPPSPILSGRLTFNDQQTTLDDICLDWMGSDLQLSGQVSNFPEFLFYDDQPLISDLTLSLDQLDLGIFIGTNSDNKPGKAEQPMDVKRLERLTQRVANNLNGQLRIKVGKLLYDTLFATNLSTQLRLYSRQNPQFKDSSMIRLDSLTASFMGKTPIYAALALSREDLPNLSVSLNLPRLIEAAPDLLPPSVQVSEGRADLQMDAKLPLRSLFQSDRLMADLRYSGRLYFDQLELKLQGSSRPIKELTGPLILGHERLVFDQVRFLLGGSPYQVTGQVRNHFRRGKGDSQKAIVDLRIHGQYFDLRPAEKPAAKNVSNEAPSPPDMFRSLKNIFQYSTGQFHITLDSLITEKRKIRPFMLQAQLIPDADHQGRHQLVVDSFDLGFGGSNHVMGHARIINPDQPEIKAQLRANLGFDQLAKLLPSQYVELQEGYVNLELQYTSPLYDTLNAENYFLKAQIDGKADLVNGKIFYNYRDFTFDEIFGSLSFNQRTLYIRKLDLRVNDNRFVARGQSTDFFPFFILPDRKAHIVLDVASPRFDFGNFTAPHGLGKDTLKTQSTVATKPDTAQSTLQQTAGYIDQLLDRGALEMTTNFDIVVYDKFIAREVYGNVVLEPDTVLLRKLRMHVARGTFTLDGSISDIIRHQPKVALQINLDQNDVREVFRQFENFGQDRLSHNNLEGVISADIQFKADINSNYDIMPESMYGDIQLKLAGGQLIDLEALNRMSGFLFRNRGLDHILIDTLNVTTHVRGQDLYVDRFYLHSSSFDFGALGVYSMASDDRTRVLFSFPIRNLFRRHISHAEMRKGNSERRGINILIDARYKDDKLRLRWKPFPFGMKKYRLNEEEEEEQ